MFEKTGRYPSLFTFIMLIDSASGKEEYSIFSFQALLEYSLTLCATTSNISVSGHGGEAPAVKAFDAYVKGSVVPLAQTCDSLGELENAGTLLLDAWEGVRAIIVLASRAKAPAESLGEALTPYLGKTQEAVKKIRDLRLKRDWDRHQKTLVEMTGALSWILFKPPQQLPAPFVKEALGSAEFWSNRIRKDFKGKDETQIAFCDNVKKALAELAKYIEEYHKAGLSFNPRGVSLAEAAIVLSDEVGDQPAQALPDGKSPVGKRHPTLKGVAAGGNVGGLMSELAGRKSADGSSAATGLRKVRVTSSVECRVAVQCRKLTIWPTCCSSV